MTVMLNKVWGHRRDLRSILHSIYFNFHYLPFKTAIRLPILLYKPKFLELKGHIKIKGNVRFGMIRLGFPYVPLYPNAGITIENHGGNIVFNGKCHIGNNSAISVGPKAEVEIGDNFCASTTFRLVSCDRIIFKDNVRFGWDNLIMDSDFHKLTKLSGGYSKGHAPIIIGSNNWIGTGCKIMKRTETPDYCVVSAGTILSGKVDAPIYSIIGSNNTIIIRATGLWRNVEDDIIQY